MQHLQLPLAPAAAAKQAAKPKMLPHNLCHWPTHHHCLCYTSTAANITVAKQNNHTIKQNHRSNQYNNRNYCNALFTTLASKAFTTNSKAAYTALAGTTFTASLSVHCPFTVLSLYLQCQCFHSHCHIVQGSPLCYFILPCRRLICCPHFNSHQLSCRRFYHRDCRCFRLPCSISTSVAIGCNCLHTTCQHFSPPLLQSPLPPLEQYLVPPLMRSFCRHRRFTITATASTATAAVWFGLACY